MKAMILRQIVSLDECRLPLELVPMPIPADCEVLIKVSACGVCHTELDEIEDRATPPILPIILGHEVVGRIERLGTGVTRHRSGDHVGVGWIHCSDGLPNETISSSFRATGRDVNGGYAKFMAVPEDYVYPIADVLQIARPLGCCAQGQLVIAHPGSQNFRMAIDSG